jgi:hypothetical protein
VQRRAALEFLLPVPAGKFACEKLSQTVMHSPARGKTMPEGNT